MGKVCIDDQKYSGAERDETRQIKILVNKGEMIYFYLLYEVWTTIPMKKEFEKKSIVCAVVLDYVNMTKREFFNKRILFGFVYEFLCV